MSKPTAELARPGAPGVVPTQSHATRFTGHVTSGLGRGADFVSLPGYADQFERLLGTEPYPGTLNVALDDDAADRSALADLDPIRLDGWTDGERSFGAVACYPAAVEPVRSSGASEWVGAYLVVPVETDHDDDTLELVAADHLRDVLVLRDGDAVVVHVGEASA